MFEMSVFEDIIFVIMFTCHQFSHVLHDKKYFMTKVHHNDLLLKANPYQKTIVASTECDARRTNPLPQTKPMHDSSNGKTCQKI